MAREHPCPHCGEILRNAPRPHLHLCDKCGGPTWFDYIGREYGRIDDVIPILPKCDPSLYPRLAELYKDTKGNCAAIRHLLETQSLETP